MLTNNIIEQVLSGNLSMDVFLLKLQNDETLQGYIRSFVPYDAKNSPNHKFWEIVPYVSLRQNNFDYYQFLFWALHSKNRFGNKLNIFSRLSRAYLFYFPDVQCTNKYRDEFSLYLDVVKDCFDGPEVRTITEDIIADSLQFKTKSQRRKHAQTIITERFHVAEYGHPRWIQGPEWPMGSCSPMAFISQKRTGESVCYEFRDVDTNETKAIKQFF